MRYGLLADVHGNLPALQVAVAVLAQEGVDNLLCAGDLVGYGPQPNECIRMLAELKATCVAGNHDLLALGFIDDRRCGALAKATQDWTRHALGSAEREFLTDLPRVAHKDELVMAHGSLDDSQTYVRSGARATAELRLAGQRWPTNRFLVLGHTHRQVVIGETRGSQRLRSDTALLLKGSDRTLINPGSVGQSREREPRPRVRFAVLDTAQRSVIPYVRDYDVTAARDLVAAHGLPEEVLHLRPKRAAVARQALRRSGAALTSVAAAAGRPRA